MLNNKIQAIITIHHIHPIRKIEIQISHTNIINKIWYILYNIDQIILNNDIAYDKVIDFIESFDDKNNYFEYIKYKLSNSVTPSLTPLYNSVIDNYSDFQDYMSYSYSWKPPSNIGPLRNQMWFQYLCNAKKDHFSFEMNGFNQHMYNTRVMDVIKYNNITQQKDIDLLKNNSMSQQEDIKLLKYNNNIFLKRYAILKDNSVRQKDEIIILKDSRVILRENINILNNNIKIHHEAITTFWNKILYLEKEINFLKYTNSIQLKKLNNKYNINLVTTCLITFLSYITIYKKQYIKVLRFLWRFLFNYST